MTADCSRYLDALQATADAASRAEGDYRVEAAGRIATLEQERAFAFRRLNLMRSMSECASAEDEQMAVTQAQSLLHDKLDWTGDSAFRTSVTTNFTPVAAAIFASASAGHEPLEAALAEFEAWYEQTYAAPFWTLFEQHIRETPVVDF